MRALQTRPCRAAPCRAVPCLSIPPAAMYTMCVPIALLLSWAHMQTWVPAAGSDLMSPESLLSQLPGAPGASALDMAADPDEDPDSVDFNPEDYSEMASVLGNKEQAGDSGRSLAVGAAIKVLDTQLYVIRGLAHTAYRTGQAIIAAKGKVSDARSQLGARLLAARLRAVRGVADAGLRAGAALAGGALDAAQAKLRALDAIVRLGLALSRSLGQVGLAGLDAADAGRDLLNATLGARLQAIRAVAEASLTLGRTLVQDLLGLPPT